MIRTIDTATIRAVCAGVIALVVGTWICAAVLFSTMPVDDDSDALSVGGSIIAGTSTRHPWHKEQWMALCALLLGSFAVALYAPRIWQYASIHTTIWRKEIRGSYAQRAPPKSRCVPYYSRIVL